MKNRITLEVFRGCTHGCRFCQAGYIYRPYRKRSPGSLLSIAEDSFAHTGHDEISLSSLNTTDYPALLELIDGLGEMRKGHPLTISIPSSRITSFSSEIMERLHKYTSGGITLAIEAGTERLRRVINKHTSDEEIHEAVRASLVNGFGDFKFYFMTGLPTETDEDIYSIVTLTGNIRKIYDELKRSGEISGRLNFQIKVSSSNFVPKPHTPFQWCAMDDIPTMISKHAMLRPIRSIRNAKLKTHNAEVSFIEGVISRGDENVGRAIETAWRMGSRFESWREQMNIDLWMDAFKTTGVNPMDYLRERNQSEEFPWDIVPSGIEKKFLWREYEKALCGEETPDCFEDNCVGCGIWNETCSKMTREK